MKLIPTDLCDVFILEPAVFGDERGFFYESFNELTWKNITGLDTRFVQHNHSRSSRGVLRGLHYQIQQPQGKLVRVIAGEVFDVAVDIRKSSPSFGRWFGTTLSAENKRMMWVPEGFAHGFCVTSESAEFLYLTTDFWAPAYERCIVWNDPQLAVDWPLNITPVVSPKDKNGALFSDADLFP